MDRDALFTENLQWAAAIARRVSQSLPPSFEIADLEQEAYIELHRRVQLFDPKMGVPFRGYAYVAIRGAVLMACRRRHYQGATHEELDGDHEDARLNPEEELIEQSRRLKAGARVRHQRAKLKRLMTTLPQAQAYVVERVLIDGRPIEELAKTWNMPEAKLAKLLAAAVRGLKRARNASR